MDEKETGFQRLVRSCGQESELDLRSYYAGQAKNVQEVSVGSPGSEAISTDFHILSLETRRSIHTMWYNKGRSKVADSALLLAQIC